MTRARALTRAGLALSLAIGAAGFGIADAADMSRAAGAAASNAAAKDYGRLSIDGVHAFEEIGLARLAIYDGKPAIATKLVTDAETALARAKTDDSVYMKAETMLQPSKNASSATPPATDATPKAWLPIDGVFTVDETLEPTSDKAKATQAANMHMRNGEPDKAREALKVADVDADYTLAVAPLRQSVGDVNRAAQLLASRDYYNASQALKQAQDGVRYDTISYADAPGAAKRPIQAASAAPLPSEANRAH